MITRVGAFLAGVGWMDWQSENYPVCVAAVMFESNLKIRAWIRLYHAWVEDRYYGLESDSM